MGTGKTDEKPARKCERCGVNSKHFGAILASPVPRLFAGVLFAGGDPRQPIWTKSILQNSGGRFNERRRQGGAVLTDVRARTGAAVGTPDPKRKSGCREKGARIRIGDPAWIDGRSRCTMIQKGPERGRD